MYGYENYSRSLLRMFMKGSCLKEKSASSRSNLFTKFYNR